MDIIDISVAEMEERVARFKELRPSKQAFVDTRLPEHIRDIFNVIGRGVTEDPELAPAIADSRYFGITYVGAEPGRGAAAHAHETIEVFIPLTSRWAVYWGDRGDKELVLEPFDCISVPPGVMRGFRNVGDSHGYLMAVIGSKPETMDGGRVAWHPEVLRRGEESGLRLTEAGELEEVAR